MLTTTAQVGRARHRGSMTRPYRSSDRPIDIQLPSCEIAGESQTSTGLSGTPRCLSARTQCCERVIERDAAQQVTKQWSARRQSVYDRFECPRIRDGLAPDDTHGRAELPSAI